MSDALERKRLTVFRVDYNYRIKRPFPKERWKKRYKWRSDSRIVRCASEFDVREELLGYIKNEFARNEYDVKIVLISPVK